MPRRPDISAVEPSPTDRDRWAKQTLVDDEAKRLRDMGVIPDMRAIEDDVNGSMQRLIARDRDGVKPQAKRKRPAKKRAEAVAKKLGYRLEKRPEARARPSAPEKKKCGACRRCKLEARLRALMFYDPAKGGFMFPAAAREITNLGFDASHGRRQFRELSIVDRNRLLNREMEDIADRSVPTLGAWR